MLLAAAHHPLLDALLVALVGGLAVGIPTLVVALRNGKKAEAAASSATEAKEAAHESSAKVAAIHENTKSTNGRTMPETLDAVQRELGDLKREHHNWRQEVGALAQEVGALARTLAQHLTEHEHEHTRSPRRRDDP